VFQTGRALHRGDDGTFWDDSREAALQPLEVVRDDLIRSYPGLGAETAVIEAGSAGPGLVLAIDGLRPALAVFGSRDGTPAGVVHAGRTVHHVLQRVRCAVGVAPGAAAAPRFRTIGVAVTDTPEGWRALAAAAALARRADARLRILPVLPPTVESQASISSAERRAERRRTAMETTLSDARDALGAGLEIRSDAVIGDPADALTAASAALDLLLMTSHGYGRQGLLGAGTIAHRVLSNARCPVIVVPHGAKLRLGTDLLAAQRS
jgi:nucleotide-binding universal stress UspA family protein